MPNVDMPPVPLMVLDGLADDIENVEKLRATTAKSRRTVSRS